MWAAISWRPAAVVRSVHRAFHGTQGWGYLGSVRCPPMRHALLELAPSAVRLLVVEVSDGGTREVARKECALRLGHAVERDGAVSEGLADLLLETVRRMRKVAARLGVSTLTPVVTGGLGLSDALLGRIGTAAGARVRLPQPTEEAAGALAEAVPGDAVAPAVTAGPWVAARGQR